MTNATAKIPCIHRLFKFLLSRNNKQSLPSTLFFLQNKKCSYSYNTIRTLSCFNIFYSKYRLVPYNNIPIANYINLSCSTFISNKLIPLHSMGKQKSHLRDLLMFLLLPNLHLLLLFYTLHLRIYHNTYSLPFLPYSVFPWCHYPQSHHQP